MRPKKNQRSRYVNPLEFMNQLKQKKKKRKEEKRNVFNQQETTRGVTTRLRTTLTMVLRKVHRLRLASKENLEIARH